MDISIKLILTFVATLIGSQGLWVLLSKISEKRSATSQLIRGLAHEQIVDKGMQYINRGWISNDEYDDFLNYLYIPYQKTGGNGLAERVKNEVDKLPFRDKRFLITNPIDLPPITDPIDLPPKED